MREALDESLRRRTLDRRVRAAADASGARVTLLGVSRSTGGAPALQTYLASDSTARTDVADLQFDVALEAARTGRPASGTEAGEDGRMAEAALPLRLTPPGSKRSGVFYVVVFSSPLEDVDATVGLDPPPRPRRRLDRPRRRAAGGVSSSARAFSRRIRRLERAAGRVAAGDFTARFETGRTDELGGLAADARRHAAPARRARHRAQPLHRHGIARAAHPDLLARRLPRAARGRGSRRGDAARVPASAARAGRPARQARHRPARPLAPGGGLAASCAPRRPTSASSRRPSPPSSHRRSPPTSRISSSAWPPSRSSAVCDPERVAQIMRILHRQRAHPHAVGHRRRRLGDPAQRPHVRLTVTDFGTGIGRAAQPRIFEPFFTSDDARRARASGWPSPASSPSAWTAS